MSDATTEDWSGPELDERIGLSCIASLDAEVNLEARRQLTWTTVGARVQKRRFYGTKRQRFEGNDWGNTERVMVHYDSRDQGLPLL